MSEERDQFQVAVNLSGGKDSVAMLLMMIERNEPIDHIIFADTGVEFPEVYEVLEQVEAFTGKTITRLSAGKSFEDMFKEGRGWPSMRIRWCTGELKKAVIQAWAKSLSVPIMHCIGIACDELKRVRKHRLKRYPLVEWGVSETEALRYCHNRGITWKGLYDSRSRVGCFCCPLQRIDELKKLRHDRRALWDRMLEMDKTPAGQRWTFRMGKTLHDYEARFSKEDMDQGGSHD